MRLALIGSSGLPESVLPVKLLVCREGIAQSVNNCLSESLYIGGPESPIFDFGKVSWHCTIP